MSKTSSTSLLKVCGFLFCSLTLFSCTDKTVGGIEEGPHSDQLALCAGGMEQGLSADLDAELKKNGGKVTSSFTQSAKGLIFNNPDINSSDKATMYNQYIQCIFKMQEKQAKADACTSVKQACMSVANTILKQCLRSQMQGCYNDCRYRGYPRDACISELCNYSRISDEAKDFYNNRCNVKEDYMDQESTCAEKYSECLTSNG